MSDRMTLALLLFVVHPVARVLDWPRQLCAGMSWLETRRSAAETLVMFEDIFSASHFESESKQQLWIDRWLRKAYRLGRAASARRSAGKQHPGL